MIERNFVAAGLMTALTGIAGNASAQCTPSASQVAVYTNSDYGGSCKVINPGDYTSPSAIGVSNDSISSIRVGSGVRALLFENSAFAGKQAFYDGGSAFRHVGSVNDTTSSLRIFFRGAPAAFRYLGNDPDELTSAAWTEEAQGIAGDALNAWYVTSSDTILKFPYGAFGSSSLATHSAGMPPALSAIGCNHFGDPDVANGFLFVPVEGCTTDGQQTPMVAVFDADNLGFVMSDHLYFQQQASWLAIDAQGDLVSSGGQFNASSPLITYDLDWSAISPGSTAWALWNGPQHTLTNLDGAPLDFSWVQGGDFNEDGSLLYLSNGGTECQGGGSSVHTGGTGVRIIETATYRQIARSGNGYGPFNFQHSCAFSVGEEPEGLDYTETAGTSAPFPGALHVVLLDNEPVSSDNAYVKHYSK